MKFDEVLEWFKKDRVTVLAGRILFCHDSYSGALEHLLTKRGWPTRVNEAIFSKVLLRLAERDEATETLTRLVADISDRLPEDIRNNLLLKLSENDKAKSVVSRIIARNSTRLPQKIKDLLPRLRAKPRRKNLS